MERSRETMKGLVLSFSLRYRIALFVLVLGMVLLGIFGRNGFLSLYRLKDQHQGLLMENETLVKSNQSLRQQIHLLKEDRSYIEQIAREEMGLVKKDEILLRFGK